MACNIFLVLEKAFRYLRLYEPGINPITAALQSKSNKPNSSSGITSKWFTSKTNEEGESDYSHDDVDNGKI